MPSKNELTAEYKILRFLNDRIEDYNIQEVALRKFLYDIPATETTSVLAELRGKGFIANKQNYELGLTITTLGQVRLNQIQREIDIEKDNIITTQKDDIIDLQKQLLRAQIKDHKWKRWDIYVGAVIGLLSSLILLFAQNRTSQKADNPDSSTEIIKVNVSTHQAAIDTVDVRFDTLKK
jgi:hypothetical protein